MARHYNTLGRRILAVLETGGARKHNILRAIAGSEERLRPTLRRLMEAGSVRQFYRQGGAHYELLKTR